MKRILCYIFLIIPIWLYSQTYNTFFIPDSLTQNANVVKRFEEIDYEIKSPGKAVMHEHHVYTILNEKGDYWGNYNSFYDKFTSINYIDAILYDARGKELKHTKKKDMADESGSGDETLISDTRYKKNDFGYCSCPYTVDYEEEDDIDGLLQIDGWHPIEAPDMSVQYSKYVITVPKKYLLRYKQFNFNKEPIITQNEDEITYTWEIKNAAAIQEESLAPAWREIVPNIMFAPSDFEAEGYKGNMTTWENYGKFIQQLKEGRDVLPADIKQKVHELTDNLTDEKQKIDTLYNFLQQSTRYISIQLGIGGWQPLDANFVGTKKYGDCKALSNYMVALLKEAGIKANYVEIAAEENAPRLVEDFPCFQSNHVICCVPMQKDTVWLECTSQNESPGFMGSFTGDRKAILIDEDGGHIVSTPRYSADDNLQLRSVDAEIDENGNLNATVNTKYTGIQEELPHSLMNDATQDERNRYLNYEFNLPTYQVDKSNYTEQKGAIPVVNESIHVTSPSYANVTGRRLFVAPNLFNKAASKLSADSVRKYDIVYNHAFKDIDSISLKIPDGYAPEAMPQNVSISNKFGTYNISFKVEGNKITCVRLHIRNKARFPASDYNDFVQFSNTIYKADRSKIIFVKKDG